MTVVADPFATAPDPDSYVPRQATEEVLAAITSYIRVGAVQVALCGPPGIGKTLLLKVVGARLESQFRVVHVPYPILSAEDISSWILGLMGEESNGNPERTLVTLARRLREDGSGLAILIDDAGSMPLPTVRRLSRLATEARPSLRLIFGISLDERGEEVVAAAGPGVETVPLDRPMNLDECRTYISARLTRAGVPDHVQRAFDDEAMNAIFNASEGIPVLANQVALEWLQSIESRLHKKGVLSEDEVHPSPESMRAGLGSALLGPSGVSVQDPWLELSQPGGLRPLDATEPGMPVTVPPPIGKRPPYDPTDPGSISLERTDPGTAPLTALDNLEARERAAASGGSGAIPLPTDPGGTSTPIRVDRQTSSIPIESDFDEPLLEVDDLGELPTDPGVAPPGQSRRPSPAGSEGRTEILNLRDTGAVVPLPPRVRRGPDLGGEAAPAPARQSVPGTGTRPGEDAPTQIQRVPDFHPSPPGDRSASSHPAAPAPRASGRVGGPLSSVREQARLKKLERRGGRRVVPWVGLALACFAAFFAGRVTTPLWDVELPTWLSLPDPSESSSATVREVVDVETPADRPAVSAPPEFDLQAALPTAEAELESLAPPPVGAGTEAIPLPVDSADAEPVFTVAAETPPPVEPTGASTAEASGTIGSPSPSVPDAAIPSAVSVSVNAQPWATIEVDGELVGVTPLAGLELGPGNHRFRATLPDGRVLERTERITSLNRRILFR